MTEDQKFWMQIGVSLIPTIVSIFIAIKEFGKRKEDPVTGSAHCVLIPYWAAVLGKKELHALQVSKRGGELFCGFAGERVRISGKAALYLEGTITI